MERNNDYISYTTQSTIPNSPGETSTELSDKDSTFIPNNDSEDVLRFYPINQLAQLAFHDLAEKSRIGELHEHHRQFLVVKAYKELASMEGYDSEATATTSTGTSEAESADSEKPVYQGYYRVNFQCKPLTDGAKWVFGRGSTKGGPRRNVDVLLAASRSRDRRKMAGAHAFLSLHPESGVWMIRAGQICNHDDKGLDAVDIISDPDGFEDCPHSPVSYNGETLKHSAFRPISQPATAIALGGMHFRVEVCIKTPMEEDRYKTSRNDWLNSRALPVPQTRISGLPLESDVYTKSAIFRHGLGSGAFGLVFEGFEPRTGDLRAIKRLGVTSEARWKPVIEEIAFNRELNGCPGIVKSYGWCNSHGQASIQVTYYPIDAYLFQERGECFSNHAWQTESDVDDKLHRALCRQLLEGVFSIHQRGWMHRDITRNNLLYFASDPPRAAIFDFGKMCRNKVDTDTNLAAWIYLPPEIQPGAFHVYDQKIDIWLLGLALIKSWFPKLSRMGPIRNPRAHQTIVTELMHFPGRGLPHLLAQMVAWDPADRPSAQRALNHPCFQDLVDTSTPIKTTNKRPKT